MLVEICECGGCGGRCLRCRLERLEHRAVTAETDLEALRDAVAAMRHAQRAFFRSRSRSALDAARRTEAAVDQLLKPREPRLF